MEQALSVQEELDTIRTKLNKVPHAMRRKEHGHRDACLELTIVPSLTGH
jgi:hypothetical protein